MKAALVLILMLVSTAVHADPVADQPRTRDPDVAIGLSVAGSVVPVAAIVAGGLTKSPPTIIAGMVGTLVGPSIGHWYGGEVGGVGLAVRLGGAAMATAGLTSGLSCAWGDTHCGNGALGVIIAGGVLYLGGTIYDCVTAGRSVDHWNARHVRVTPTVVGSGRGTMGLGLTGEF